MDGSEAVSSLKSFKPRHEGVTVNEMRATLQDVEAAYQRDTAAKRAMRSKLDRSASSVRRERNELQNMLDFKVQQAAIAEEKEALDLNRKVDEMMKKQEEVEEKEVKYDEEEKVLPEDGEEVLFDEEEPVEPVEPDACRETAEPATIEPTTIEPTPSEPMHVEPAATAPVDIEPVTSEPAHINPTPSEPAHIQPVASEPASSAWPIAAVHSAPTAVGTALSPRLTHSPTPDPPISARTSHPPPRLSLTQVRRQQWMNQHGVQQITPDVDPAFRSRDIESAATAFLVQKVPSANKTAPLLQEAPHAPTLVAAATEEEVSFLTEEAPCESPTEMAQEEVVEEHQRAPISPLAPAKRRNLVVNYPSIDTQHVQSRVGALRS